MTKLNISIPQQRLNEIDAEAATLGPTQWACLESASALHRERARTVRPRQVGYASRPPLAG
jgi:hypothetical protein